MKVVQYDFLPEIFDSWSPSERDKHEVLVAWLPNDCCQTITTNGSFINVSVA